MSSTASATGETEVPNPHKRNSNDMGWEWGKTFDDSNKDRVQCLLCGHKMHGGVRRIQEHIAHIAGNVIACPKSTKEEHDRCRQNIFGVQAKKKAKHMREQEVRDQVVIQEEEEDHKALEGLDSIGDSTTRKKKLGPMDRFATPVDPAIPLTSKQLKQKKIDEEIYKEKLHKVKQYVARWLYAHGITLFYPYLHSNCLSYIRHDIS